VGAGRHEHGHPLGAVVPGASARPRPKAIIDYHKNGSFKRLEKVKGINKTTVDKLKGELMEAAEEKVGQKQQTFGSSTTNARPAWQGVFLNRTAPSHSGRAVHP